MPTDTAAPLLRPSNLAQLLCISERHLRDVRTEDATLPAPITVGASLRWRPQEVSDWLAYYENKRTPRTGAPNGKARPTRRRSNPAADQGADAIPPLRPDIPERAWCLPDVQQYLNVSARTLQRLRAQDPTFPAPRYLSSAQRWHPHIIRTWEPQQ